MLFFKTKIIGRLVVRYQVPQLAESQEKLGAWLATAFGQRLYAAELEVIARNVFKVPGYRVAQLGVSPTHKLITNLPHKHQITLAPMIDANAACVCEFHSLPLPTNTLDAILLHHVLDYSPEPHKVLSETARVVSAGGYIILVAYNPFSIFGLGKWLIGSLSRQPEWRHNSLRKGRLIDWLQLVGFQIVATEYAKKILFKRQEEDGLYSRCIEWVRWRISSRAFYVLLARKQTIPLNSISPFGWQPVNVSGFSRLKTNTINGQGKGRSNRS